jgi:hypothetical protein
VAVGLNHGPSTSKPRERERERRLSGLFPKRMYVLRQKQDRSIHLEPICSPCCVRTVLHREVAMFGSRQQGTVIPKGLKIVGSVTAEGLVWVNGQIDGELHCTYLVIDKGAHISGTVSAERVIVDGKVSKVQFREKRSF